MSCGALSIPRNKIWRLHGNGDETYGDAWVWVAFAPGWRLVVAFVVGKRTQEQANLLLDRVVYVTDDRVPFFTSDQWSGYPTTLLHAYRGMVHSPNAKGNGDDIPPPVAPPAELAVCPSGQAA